MCESLSLFIPRCFSPLVILCVIVKTISMWYIAMLFSLFTISITILIIIILLNSHKGYEFC